MSIVLRVEHADLPLGLIEFTHQEARFISVLDSLDRQVDRTQGRRAIIYEDPPELAIATITFRMARFSTIYNLDMVRRVNGAFTVYPFLPYDAVTRFDMIWPNPNVVVQRFRGGYPLANYDIEAEWEESVGAVCLPPS